MVYQRNIKGLDLTYYPVGSRETGWTAESEFSSSAVLPVLCFVLLMVPITSLATPIAADSSLARGRKRHALAACHTGAIFVRVHITFFHNVKNVICNGGPRVDPKLRL